MNKCIHYLPKIILFLTFSLYTIGLIAAWNHPINGYESSIYLSTPLIFWIAVTLCLTLGVFLILYAVYKKEKNYILFTKLGWLLLILFSFSLTGLFIIRGYGILNLSGDTGTHYGNLKYLLEAGVTTSSYPGTYIEIATLHLMTGIELSQLLNLNSLIYVGIFLFGLCLLSRTVCESKYERIFVMIIGFLLPFGSTYYATGGFSLSMYVPYISTFLIFPIYLYLLFSFVSDQRFHATRIILILLVSLNILIGHILVFFTCCLIIYVLILLHLILMRYSNWHFKGVRSLLSLFITLSILFLSWSFYLNLMHKRIISYSDFILYDSETGIYAETLTQTVANEYLGNLSLLEQGELILRQGGLLIILGFFFTLFIFDLIVNIKKGKYYALSVFYVLVIHLLLVVSVSFVVYSGFQPGRLMQFVSLCSIFSAGIILSSLYQNFLENSTKRKKLVFGSTVIFILSILAVLSIVSYYPSIHTVVSTPKQVTESSLDGFDFYFMNCYFYDEIGIINGPLWRYSQVLYSSIFIKQDIVKKIGGLSPPLDHFGYPSCKLLGENYASPTYLLLMNSCLTNYNENPLWKHNPPPFNKGDIEQVSSDQTVSKIYDNPEFSISVIYPAASLNRA